MGNDLPARSRLFYVQKLTQQIDFTIFVSMFQF